MLNVNEVKNRMDKIVTIFLEDISSIRTGRATPSLLENVVVTAYGNKMKLIELGSIGVSDVRTLTFQPWDNSIIREIANGISAANIGMNPAAVYVDKMATIAPIYESVANAQQEIFTLNEPIVQEKTMEERAAEFGMSVEEFVQAQKVCSLENPGECEMCGS